MSAPARYGAADHTWWVDALGGLYDPDGPGGEHRLEGRHLDAYWPVGCYVAVDLDERAVYVGQVNRTIGGFAERFGAHHQPVDEWHRIWLLPLRPGLAASLVSLVEALLIWRLRPEANCMRPAPTLEVTRP